MKLLVHTLVRKLMRWGLLAGLAIAFSPALWAMEECSLVPEVTPDPPDRIADEKVKIKADKITFPQRKVVRLHGYTQLIRGGHRVFADELTYYKSRNQAKALGTVKVRTAKGDVVETSILDYYVDAGVAISGPATFLITNRPSGILGNVDSTVNAFGSAERVTLRSDNTMLLENARVTSCLDGRKDVTFKAEELTVDLEEGVRTGTGVKVQIAEPSRHKRVREIVN